MQNKSLHNKANRLNHEKSPYLLQHAYNPVDWYPWGEEAFQKAKREGKPIFLSIGYSTCHWCHVMERESFEDQEVAQMINERFVAIKVDREERPDLDSVYMTICHMMNGMGGWPLSVFMTPEQVPFYSGTYFPKESRYGMPGLKDVIIQLYQNFKQQPDKVKNIEKNVQHALDQAFHITPSTELSEEVLDHTYSTLFKQFDRTYGGFGNAPKFPRPHTLTFLLRYYDYSGQEEALNMVTKTLDGLAAGGIYDHVGFGFSRYSVDEKYLVPHFEKMLYDQALLGIAYTEAYQVTKEPRFKKTADEIMSYVLRDLTHPEGGFYSAEDADSEGEEGKFYVWTPDEIKGVLGNSLGEQFCEIYNITDHGNFEGKSIPNVIGIDLQQYASSYNSTEKELAEALDHSRAKLFEARKKRIHPFKDDKVITSWNGMMIAALAKASRVFENDTYINAAKHGLEFIETHLIVDDRLMVRYRDGEVKHLGLIDDYAYMLWAYLEMYEATYDLEYIQKANHLSENMFKLFLDEEGGGFYLYGHDHEQLIARPKEAADGAVPSGNSVAALQLLRLARLTGDHQKEEVVEKMLHAFSDDLAKYSDGHVYLMQTYLLTKSNMKEVVILQGMNNGMKPLLDSLRNDFYPSNTTLVAVSPEELKEVAPFAGDYTYLNNQSTAYICENFSCHTPTTRVDKAFRYLKV
ncbi:MULTISPECIES: thioredoxin domain-containing protein [Pontibacillus]|uniref:Thioredoxin domain-containing protein n=1 Tax=Pontibacillus chungwhensis TaxID=265426 RepID=A0ABY8USA9_9BACI|nr:MULTISPECIES: thioredoxin domain-containing protein [Pontibacillus]MCD5323170.1 thioredoxin domain-containing protein [Pontibacillus sp. HN14]WIF96557.1 thioredoxin domain-containing protein [Pontibacillus chungwhensis]